MGTLGQSPRGFARWFSNDFILTTARRFYLVVAFASFAAALIAVAIAMVFELGILASGSETSIYTPQAGQADLAPIDARLSPPQNIHFVSNNQLFSNNLTGTEILGYFDASTPNGLAQFPDDFDIIGGSGANYFQPVAFGNPPRTALQPSAALIGLVNKALPTLRQQKQSTFVVRIVAHDSYDNRSPATDVPVTITYGPAPTVSEPVPQLTDLQSIAKAIAVKLDPAKTPAYFDFYNRALRVPAQCGAGDDDVAFIGDYRVAFEHARDRLNRKNIEAFYGGVCESWQQEMNKVSASQAARTASEAAAALRRFGATIARNSAVTFAIGAVLAFMFVSLFLAFLAIEGHSRAMQKAVEVLSKKGAEKEPSEAPQ